MNPNPQTSTQPPMWEDEIDLRELIEALLRRKWLIIGFVAVAALVAAVYSYVIATPKFEAAVVVALPSASASERFGMTVPAYEAFAANSGVLEHMIQAGGLDIDNQRLRERLQIRLDANPRLLTVTAYGSTGAEAYRLAELWLDAFQASLASYARAFFAERLRSASDNVLETERALLEASKTAEDFERENALSVKEARLLRWESELVSIEARWDQLTRERIPEDAGRVVILEQMLSEISPTLDAHNGSSIVATSSGLAGVESSPVTVLNPDYLELSRDLSQTKSRLASNRHTADLLAERLAELPPMIDNLRVELRDLRAIALGLRNEVSTTEQLHRDALRAYQGALGALSDATSFSAVSVVAEPLLPRGPVAPRKMLNIALAVVLGGFVGVGVALFQNFWYGSGVGGQATGSRQA